MPPRWQPSLEDYIDIAAYLLGADRAAVARLPGMTLAESALHAPFASFGGTEAYPTLVEQAAVLLQHLANNHPLPEANKRSAFLLTARSLDVVVSPVRVRVPLLAGMPDGCWISSFRHVGRDPQAGPERGLISAWRA